MRRRLTMTFGSIATWLCGVALLAAGERWSITSMGGVEVGYLHETVAQVTGDPGTSETRREVKMVFNRLGNRLAFESAHVLRETEAGRLVSAQLTDALGAQPTTTMIEVRSDCLVVRSQTADRRYQREVVYDGELLGPEGVRCRTLAKLARPGDEVRFLMLVGELAQPKPVTRTCTEKTADGMVVRETIESLPPRMLWLDADGSVRRSRDEGPFGVVVTELADRERALATVQSTTELPAEMFARTVIRSNVRLPGARALESLTVRIEHTGAALPWPTLASHDQRVVSQSDAASVVTIERVAPPDASAAVGELDLDEMNECLEANATINSDDEAIRAIAQDVTREQRGAWQMALVLRDWVTDHMTFDLGVAQASAGEVVRKRHGTCAAYAALLAALCRAAGIPARYVLGIVYVNGAWGGHAWVEVGIQDRWIPIDAALPSDGVADAARLRVGASSLRDGPGALSSEAGKLYGQVAIDVLSYRVADRTVELAPDHMASRVAGQRYANADLGLTLDAPAGFSFSEVDAVWPKEALVTLLGPEHAKVELVQTSVLTSKPRDPQIWSALQARAGGGQRREVVVHGEPVHAIVGGAKSALAITSGNDLWLIVAEGTALDPWLASLSIGKSEAVRSR